MCDISSTAEKNKNIKQTRQWREMFFLTDFPGRRTFGAQRNIWKLVALRVTQHVIKQETIPNHSPLSLVPSQTNDPENLAVCLIPLLSWFFFNWCSGKTLGGRTRLFTSPLAFCFHSPQPSFIIIINITTTAARLQKNQGKIKKKSERQVWTNISVLWCC